MPVVAQKDKNEKLRANVKVIANRAIPWQSTTYYTTPGTASTRCYGEGTWRGSYSPLIWGSSSSGSLDMNTSCTTTYTDPMQIPITSYEVDIYNLVETDTHSIVIHCRWIGPRSKCFTLRPGYVYGAEFEGDKLFVIGHIGMEGDPKRKRLRIKYSIVRIDPKQTDPNQTDPKQTP
jgi:hypothetical protein